MSESLNDNEAFGVLADVLETMRVRGTIFFRSELSAPWGIELEARGALRFHISIMGSCVVATSSEAPVNIGEMDIVILPNEQDHWIADRAGRALIPSRRASEACELNNPLFQDGETTHRLMCGLVQFDTAMSHPILNTFPNIFHLTGIDRNESIWLTIRSIDAELQNSHGRSGRIVDKLTEVLILQLLDRSIATDIGTVGFLAALGDRRVLRALAVIHRNPAYDWTLISLGEQSGMSRATLSRNFDAAMGMSPMAYLTNWRLVKAYNLAKYSMATTQQIAESVGFKSAKTLTRAFQRRYGSTPSSVRRDK